MCDPHPASRQGTATELAAEHRRRPVLLVAALALLVASALIVLAPSARAGAGCDLFASPVGSDGGAGTYQSPFRTVQELVNALRAGQTGCLLSGTYYGNVRIGIGGNPGAPLTLAAAPGQAATVVGRVAIMHGANYVTVTGLTLNGSNPTRLASPTVLSGHVTFSYDDVTNNHSGICFVLGTPGWGRATDTLLTHDRIHDCGQLTPADNYQHGVYIAAASGTKIEWSLIYGNAARGIQMFPNAQYTTIDHNIIDDNGEGIIVSGEGGSASSHTNIYDNIVSNATARHDVESWWPVGNPVGVANTLHDNCVWGGRQGGVDTSGGGLHTTSNLHINPRFVNGRAHDYEMSANSTCLALVGDVQAAVDRTAPVQPPAATMDATRRALARAAAKHRRHNHPAKKRPQRKRR